MTGLPFHPGFNGLAPRSRQGPDGETAEQAERAVAAAMPRPRDLFRDAIGEKFDTGRAQEAAAQCGKAILATKTDGYVRHACDNRMEVFDEEGRLSAFMIDTGREYLAEVDRDAKGRSAKPRAAP